MKRKEKIDETEKADKTQKQIKKSGLCIRTVELSEAKEHCAYQSCNESVAFYLESLFVCQNHAVSLMHCFIPNESKE